MRRTVAIVLTIVGVAAFTYVQYTKRPAPGVPRTPDGKVDMAAAAPRTADGKPDLSGIWTTDGTGPEEMERLFPGLADLAVPGDDPRDFSKYFLNVFADVQQQDVPMRPDAVPILMARLKDGFATHVPTSKCQPAGIPMGDLLPSPRRFVQTPDLLVIVSEGINPPRLIHLDGRPLPTDPNPQWLGHSTGTWDADTLVVDTVGFTDLSWIDGMGHPRSEAMRITERLRRRDFGHVEVQVTFDDPKMYTKPFSIAYTQTLLPDAELLEYVCTENEKPAIRTASRQATP